MSVYSVLGAGLAVLMYLPLWRHIKNDKDAKQNLISWVLWVGLDVIALVSVVLQGGNAALLFVYVGGSIITTFLVYKYCEKPGWELFHTVTLFLVVVCIVFWKTSGDKWATIASSIAVVIAGFPQLADTWAEPRKAPVAIYCGSLTANILTVAGGKEWSVAERFYSSCVALLCAGLILLACRRYLSSYKATTPSFAEP